MSQIQITIGTAFINTTIDSDELIHKAVKVIKHSGTNDYTVLLDNKDSFTYYEDANVSSPNKYEIFSLKVGKTYLNGQGEELTIARQDTLNGRPVFFTCSGSPSVTDSVFYQSSGEVVQVDDEIYFDSWNIIGLNSPSVKAYAQLLMDEEHAAYDIVETHRAFQDPSVFGIEEISKKAVTAETLKVNEAWTVIVMPSEANEITPIFQLYNKNTGQISNFGFFPESIQEFN